MPIHDWTRVGAGIFHDFHISWVCRISEALNSRILPDDYYALSERHPGPLDPDVLTRKGLAGPRDEPGFEGTAVGLKVAPPRTAFQAESDASFYRRKRPSIVVRRASGDDVVAMIEIVSPGNKDSRRALRAFVDKAAWLLDQGVHLLVADLHPPTPRDPSGIHGAIWEEITGRGFEPPAGKPLTVVTYEADNALRAYIEPLAVGDALPEMPLFLRPGAYVEVPLEATYQVAWESVPLRWRRVVEREG
jgi:hypothetical protein